QLSVLETGANRRAPWKVAIGKRLVDDRHTQVRTLVGDLEEAAFAQAGADCREVLARHGAHEGDLPRDTVLRLAGEQIKCRLRVVYLQWNLRGRAGVDHAGNGANRLQL